MFGRTEISCFSITNQVTLPMLNNNSSNQTRSEITFLLVSVSCSSPSFLIKLCAPRNFTVTAGIMRSGHLMANKRQNQEITFLIHFLCTAFQSLCGPYQESVLSTLVCHWVGKWFGSRIWSSLLKYTIHISCNRLECIIQKEILIDVQKCMFSF